MIPIVQLKRGGPDASPDERGDCFEACICSTLELPAGSIEPVWDDDWWGKIRAQLHDGGFDLLWLEPMIDVPAGFWIATVPSLNLGHYENGHPVMHSVVMDGAKLAHDPSRGKRYDHIALDLVARCFVVLPLNPIERVA